MWGLAACGFPLRDPSKGSMAFSGFGVFGFVSLGGWGLRVWGLGILSRTVFVCRTGFTV